MRLLLEKIENKDKDNTITVIMSEGYHAMSLAKAIKAFCQIADRGGDCTMLMKMSNGPFKIADIGHDVRNATVFVGDEEIGNQDVIDIVD